MFSFVFAWLCMIAGKEKVDGGYAILCLGVDIWLMFFLHFGSNLSEMV